MALPVVLMTLLIVKSALLDGQRDGLRRDQTVNDVNRRVTASGHGRALEGCVRGVDRVDDRDVRRGHGVTADRDIAQVLSSTGQ